MSKRPKIVVIGSMIFDFVARAQRLPRKGETLLGTGFGMYTGGKGANQAVQAGRLGAEVHMVGRVGADYQGERVIRSLRESGVNTDYVIADHDVETSVCCIHVDANGDNDIIISPGANMACSVEDIDKARDIILSSDIAMFQLEIPIPVIEYAIKMVSDRGIPIILNPAPANKVPENLFAKAKIITPNETEAEAFSGIPACDDGKGGWEKQAAERLMALGSETVIITLGKRGALLAEKGKCKTIPTFSHIKAVDTTAAGDAFNGALAVALAEGKEMEEAVVFANAAGSLAASRPGAQSSLCTRQELEALLKTGPAY